MRDSSILSLSEGLTDIWKETCSSSRIASLSLCSNTLFTTSRSSDPMFAVHSTEATPERTLSSL